MRGLLLAVIGLFTLLMNGVQGHLKISHVSTAYLPSAGTQTVVFDGKAVEQMDYDPVRKLIYAAGTAVYHVINATDPGNLTVEYTWYEGDANVDFTDVEVCGDHVFMAIRNGSDPSYDALRVYKSFDAARPGPLELVVETRVGPLPDMLYVLKDCKTVIVALEGETYVLPNGTLVDPAGQISIVHFAEGVDMASNDPTVTSLGFDAFNNRYDELKPSGVRFVYTENNSQFSNDVEPEYITVDEDANKAYVVLQENNAIAEVDLITRTITSIRGLGYKQWGSLDASDRDGGIRITYWPIRAWYLPDSIEFYQWQNRKLLFTANEGDGKYYSTTPPFDEQTRGKDIPASELGPEIHRMVRSAIGDEALLGRLKFSRLDGREESGNYSALYTYGGRSFSIWDMATPGGDDASAAAASLPLIFDSGSQFEEMMALHCPHLFNGQGARVDSRSDDKGPEPESIALGEFNNRLYIFIGLERPGTIAVYSLGRDVSSPRFETLFCGGIPDDSRTYDELLADRELYGVDPESLRFLSAAESPTGRPLLIAVGTVSSTVTLLDLNVTHAYSPDQPDQNVPTPTCPGSGVISAASLMLVYLCLLLHLG